MSTVKNPLYLIQNSGQKIFGIDVQEEDRSTERKNNIILFEGIRRSSSYICDILKSTSCDILCLQETWTMDSNLEHIFIFAVIIYLHVYRVFNHTANMIKGRPYGGVAMFYKKSMSNVITHI